MPTEFSANPGTVKLTDLAATFSTESVDLKGAKLDDGSIRIYEGKSGLKTTLGLKTPSPEKQKLAKQMLFASIENQYSKDMAERLFSDFHIGKASTKVSGELIHQLQERAIGLSKSAGIGGVEEVSMRDVVESTGMELFKKLHSHRDIKAGDLCISVFPLSKEYTAGHVAFFDAASETDDSWQDKGSTPARNDKAKDTATYVRICDDKLATRLRGMLTARRSAMPFMAHTAMATKGAGPFVKTLFSAHTELKSERPKVLEHALVDMSYLKTYEWAQQQISDRQSLVQPTRDMEALRSTLFGEQNVVKIALKESPDQDTLLRLDDRLDDALDRLPGKPYAERPDTSVIDDDGSLTLREKVEKKHQLLVDKTSEMGVQIGREETDQKPLKKQIKALEQFCRRLMSSESWSKLHPDEPGVYCSSFSTRMLQSAQLSLELDQYIDRDPGGSPLAALSHAVTANVETLTLGIREEIGLSEPGDTSAAGSSTEVLKGRVDEMVTWFMQNGRVDAFFAKLPKGMDITPRASPHTAGKGAGDLAGDDGFLTRDRTGITVGSPSPPSSRS